MVLDILLKHVLPALILIYVGFGLILFLFQRQYIFYPTENDFVNCPALSDAEVVRYGETRAYLHDTGGPLVVLYHGNAESACSRAYYAREFYEPLGLSYLLVEYTGFSGDERAPSAEALYQNAADTVEFLKERAFSRTIIMAESIGSAPAAYHAALTDVDALILTSPFTSLESVAKHHYPLYPVSLLLRERLETTAWLNDTDAVVHLIHGTNDTLVPFSESETIRESLQSERVTLTPIDGADHIDIYAHPRWHQTVNGILSGYNGEK